jgi:REP element-mobilizing transposase RayT
MPDHVHVLAQPHPAPQGGFVNLTDILHSVKTFSARRINKLRKVKGSLWQAERYDRVVRDAAEFFEKWEYIRYNTVIEGLVGNPEDYPWLYEKP